MSHNTDSMPIGEAANFLGVPQAQLRRWALQGVGPQFDGPALVPERMAYSYVELQEWQERIRQDTYEIIGIAAVGRLGSA